MTLSQTRRRVGALKRKFAPVGTPCPRALAMAPARFRPLIERP